MINGWALCMRLSCMPERGACLNARHGRGGRQEQQTKGRGINLKEGRKTTEHGTNRCAAAMMFTAGAAGAYWAALTRVVYDVRVGSASSVTIR